MSASDKIQSIIEMLITWSMEGIDDRRIRDIDQDRNGVTGLSIDSNSLRDCQSII